MSVPYGSYLVVDIGGGEGVRLCVSFPFCEKLWMQERPTSASFHRRQTFQDWKPPSHKIRAVESTGSQITILVMMMEITRRRVEELLTRLGAEMIGLH